MTFKKNILEAMGSTPIVQLNKVSQGSNSDFFVKCEFMNPGGSIKDRIGAYIIEQAEKRGEIKPGGTIVEATSGNTGMGLAIAAAVKGYKTVFVMPDKMSEEKRQNLRAFGAKVVICPTAVEPEDSTSYYSVAKRLVKETSNCFYSNQYHNLDNRETHYRTTGPEIWEQTQGKIDAIVMGMGTCGTISGIGKYFKEKDPNIKIVGVDPKGSLLKQKFETGEMGDAHGYVLEGIGEDMIPENCDFSVIDQIVQIEDKESFVMTRRLLKEEGIFCGMSCGAAVVGALRYASQMAQPEKILVILPDSGNRYLSKVFNDAWMIENGYMDVPLSQDISKLLRVLGKEKNLVGALNSDSVGSVVQSMKNHGISQLPVYEDGEIIGVVTETLLLRGLINKEYSSDKSVASLVSKDFEVLDNNHSIETLNEKISEGKAVFIKDDLGEVSHVLTQIDLLSFLSRQKEGVIHV